MASNFNPGGTFCPPCSQDKVCEDAPASWTSEYGWDAGAVPDSLDIGFDYPATDGCDPYGDNHGTDIFTCFAEMMIEVESEVTFTMEDTGNCSGRIRFSRYFQPFTFGTNVSRSGDACTASTRSNSEAHTLVPGRYCLEYLIQTANSNNPEGRMTWGVDIVENAP